MASRREVAIALAEIEEMRTGKTAQNALEQRPHESNNCGHAWTLPVPSVNGGPIGVTSVLHISSLSSVEHELRQRRGCIPFEQIDERCVAADVSAVFAYYIPRSTAFEDSLPVVPLLMLTEVRAS